MWHLCPMTLHEAITLIDHPAFRHSLAFSASALPGPKDSPGSPVPRSQPSTRPLTWADLGCGSGLFTEALAQLLPTGSTVFGVDTKPTLRQKPTSEPGFPAIPGNTTIIPIKADFEKDLLALQDLDGILMANSLHYIKDKPVLLQKLKTYTRPGSPFLIVEYDTDKPVGSWVPYPLSYSSLTKLFTGRHIEKLGERPSVYGRANIYAAVISA